MTTRPVDVNVLPEGLPIPQDDGACVHLHGFSIPDMDFPTTDGARVNLRTLPGGTVVYIYPCTGSD